MENLSDAIAAIRDSTVAVLRIRRAQAVPVKFELSIVGTAWCVVQDTYLVTAHHLLNDRKPRNPADRFYVLAVPQNGPVAFHIPVTGFVLEDLDVDMAVFRIGPSGEARARLSACPVIFAPRRDGDRVLTYGFPAPAIVRATVDQRGDYAGGELFLKAHANEGIVAASYEVNGVTHYELNVGWHHGESGGPIFSINSGPTAAFALMQEYRNVQSPHGVMAGPHVGRSVSAIERTLRQIGATVL